MKLLDEKIWSKWMNDNAVSKMMLRVEMGDGRLKPN